MIQMEYPKLPLDGLTPEEQTMALKRQVDILTDNLQIVLNSIEADIEDIGSRAVRSDETTANILERLGCETFQLTAETGFIGYLYGVYDKASRTVRLNFWAGLSDEEGTKISTKDVLFVIPEKYRPASTKFGSCTIRTSLGDKAFGYDARVLSIGAVGQGLSNYVVRLEGSVEYEV